MTTKTMVLELCRRPKAPSEATAPFVNAYVRIDARGYRNGGQIGWQDEADRARFHQTVIALFEERGFTLENCTLRSACPTMTRGHESIYCHPDHLDGVFKRERIADIEAAIEQLEGIKWRGTDVYDQYHDLSAEEIAARLEELAPELEQRVFEAHQTKRRTLAFSGPNLSAAVDFAESRVQALPTPENKRQVSAFVGDVFDTLLNQGAIVTHQWDGRTFYRALNKTELRKARKPLRRFLQATAA